MYIYIYICITYVHAHMYKRTYIKIYSVSVCIFISIYLYIPLFSIIVMCNPGGKIRTPHIHSEYIYMTSLLSDLTALKRAFFLRPQLKLSQHAAWCKSQHLPKASKPNAGWQNQAVVRTEIQEGWGEALGGPVDSAVQTSHESWWTWHPSSPTSLRSSAPFSSDHNWSCLNMQLDVKVSIFPRRQNQMLAGKIKQLCAQRSTYAAGLSEESKHEELAGG